MTALFLETCTERSVLFFYDGTVRYRHEFPIGLNNSKYIFPALQEGLRSLRIGVSDLSFIGVGIGPGSYTGMRVGASVAKGLSFGSHVPLVGVPTLKCFVPPGDGHFAVVIDAKIRGVYAIMGYMDKGVIAYASESKVVSLEAFGSELAGVEWIVTPNATVLKPKLEELYPSLATEWVTSAPEPMAMGRVAFEMFQSESKYDNTQLDLLYL
jgi:tRNA threonylcarbamoyladenosine biosynthesis protein TsaB